MNSKISIPCSLRSSHQRKTVQLVLKQIQLRYPKDFQRLQSLVREIAPYDDADEGDLGIWVRDKTVSGDPSTWGYGGVESPGIVKVAEDLRDIELMATLAHELGHAATRDEDLKRRGELWFEEWQHELAADWYAYRWGFGRLIAKTKNGRAWGHHGGWPGSTFEIEEYGVVYKFKITRSFVVHLVEKYEGTLS